MTTTLDDVARKYRAMVRLRTIHARTGSVAPREELRALAAEFPGALKELDRLPMSTLVERADATTEASRDPAKIAPWMRWITAYHALMAATLDARAALARARSISDDRAAELAAIATRRASLPLDADYVRAVASPPGGRLTDLALARLAAHFSTTPAALRAAMFPRATTASTVIASAPSSHGDPAWPS